MNKKYVNYLHKVMYEILACEKNISLEFIS
jgi:hypothetical protein